VRALALGGNQRGVTHTVRRSFGSACASTKQLTRCPVFTCLCRVYHSLASLCTVRRQRARLGSRPVPGAGLSRRAPHPAPPQPASPWARRAGLLHRVQHHLRHARRAGGRGGARAGRRARRAGRARFGRVRRGGGRRARLLRALAGVRDRQGLCVGGPVQPGGGAQPQGARAAQSTSLCPTLRAIAGHARHDCGWGRCQTVAPQFVLWSCTQSHCRGRHAEAAATSASAHMPGPATHGPSITIVLIPNPAHGPPAARRCDG